MHTHSATHNTMRGSARKRGDDSRAHTRSHTQHTLGNINCEDSAYLCKSQTLSKTRGGSHVQRNALVPLVPFQYALAQAPTTESEAVVQVIVAAPITAVHAAGTKTNVKAKALY